MKARADRRALADAIAWVAQAIPKRASHAALLAIKLTANGDRLTLRAFDYDTSHEAHVVAEVTGEGECLIPASFLKDVVGTLRGEAIELVLDDGRLTASAGRSTYRVQTLALADFPDLPAFPKRVGKIDAIALQHAIVGVTHTADDDAPFESIVGLHLEGTADELVTVATDRFSLGTVTVDWSGSDFMCTAPSRAMAAATKGLAGEVTLGFQDGHLGFQDEQRTVTMRCYSEDYVPWRKLMREPHADTMTVAVDAGDLLDAVKRAQRITPEGRSVILTIRADEIELNAEGDEKGAGTEFVEAEATAELEVRVDPRRLAACVAASVPGQLVIGLTGPTKALMLRPADQPGTTYVVMPKHKN